MSLESNKTLGGIGALLVAIGCVVPILSIVGIILVMIAMKGLAEYYNENSIFQDALYGIIFYIIAIVAAAVVLMGALFGGMLVSPGADVLAIMGGVILAAVVMFIFYLLGSLFFKKSFNTLSTKSGEKMFDTAGLLMLLGAVLTIILIGVILLLVAWILAAVAFFSMKIPTAQPTATTPQLPPPPP
jgi:uncharacterized membrane protein